MMTDYKEEQANEIEALESIYPDEINVITKKPFYSFEMTINTSSEEYEVENASCIIQFTYTATYPDESPVMEVKESENLDDEHVDQLMKFMKEQAEENLGMVMVFTIVSAIQEKLTELVEDIANNKTETEARKKRELEDIERKKFEGTRVTIETFIAWKAKFDSDISDEKRRQGLVEKVNKQKPSGKDLFMQDQSLDDSDMKFLEEEGDVVTVDESLFQDLEDLDLEADIEDLDEAAAS